MPESKDKISTIYRRETTKNGFMQSGLSYYAHKAHHWTRLKHNCPIPQEAQGAALPLVSISSSYFSPLPKICSFALCF